ncbi:MAG TPA: acyl-CoA dehydrogenase family protein, partial [Rugosibacter sp.]
MNPYIDEDLAMLAEQARRFATERVAPGFLERDQTRVLDRTLMREMGQMGFIAPELPEQHGGQGLG